MFSVLLCRSLQTILFGSESGAVLTVAGLFLLLFLTKRRRGKRFPGIGHTREQK
jgi:hypothetical protein